MKTRTLQVVASEPTNVTDPVKRQTGRGGSLRYARRWVGWCTRHGGQIEAAMENKTRRSSGFANRTPWQEAIREVPPAWLEAEADKSPSPRTLLASWKGDGRGVPSHVMLKLLRRRLGERRPEARAMPLPAKLHQAQDMLAEIWAGTSGAGARDSSWRLVEDFLRTVCERVSTVQTGQRRRHHDGKGNAPL